MMRILVVGAGLGGLCLSHSLQRMGAEVSVFDRDASPWARPQGYRLHLDADAVAAIHAAVPNQLYRLFEATTMVPEPFTTIVDTSLAVQRRFISDGPAEPAGRPDRPILHANVNRATLREILLTGLDDVIQWDEKLVHFDSDHHGVTATFASGRTERGDLLVGADGIHSAVRRLRLPQLQLQDTGVRAIYGRIPMSTAVDALPAQVLGDVFTVAVDDRKVFFGLGPVAFPVAPDTASQQIYPAAGLRPQGDYVVSIVGGRSQFFGHDDTTLRGLSSIDLQSVAGQVISGWPEAVNRLPSVGDPTSFFIVEMFTSIPAPIGHSLNVTVLGDAVHAMTPTLGRGANIAMRDARILVQHLKPVLDKNAHLSDALRAYEDDMTSYAFKVVRDSAAMGTRLMGQQPLPSSPVAAPHQSHTAPEPSA
jgi:2-polyprenyl-6-methoxyphenol hydroxylase-like FAD-dependent oxidoreductase